MTPDKEEIKEGLLSFIPQEFLPEIYIIKESWYYMLDGITKLCLDEFKWKTNKFILFVCFI